MTRRTIEVYGRTLPAKRIVCPRCDGEGKHMNPSIDGHGMTEEEWHHAGPDFREDYCNGVFDVKCYRCSGEKVVDVVDRAQLDTETLRWLEAEDDAAAHDAAVRAAERRMGC